MNYDYIIVGAGSAGCVMANRLSADRDSSVLLLEAGPADKERFIHIPISFWRLFRSEIDWNYETEPESYLDQRRMYWPRGKVLGGSSSTNAMIYIRGQRRDYDRWAEAGNEGWGYDEILSYFKKAQHQERGASPYHGVDGPLNVADLRSPHPLSLAFVKASIEAGYPANDDFNGETQTGFGLYQVTQKNGKRHSTAVAYLNPALDRPNLSLETDAQVSKISFDGRQATGIRYNKNGQTHEAKADKEIILCGGTINSPQLLLLSGIGPADHLQSLGIPVVHDLPGVGRNLQDHLAVPVAYDCKQPITLIGAKTIGNILKFKFFKSGLLTSNIGEAGGFFKSRPDVERPDIQMIFTPVFYVDPGVKRRPEGHGFTLMSILLRPKSRGFIRLKSTDPQQTPLIQANYCEQDVDIQTLVTGVRTARKIAAAPALDPYRGAERLPGEGAQDDEALRSHVRRESFTMYHPVGTCKMGHDPMAVVNPRLQVHGVDGLRVVDASIMPTIVRGNTNAPVIMIAEKAADMINDCL